MNKTYPVRLRCRLSEAELQSHKTLVKELNISSQKFLYLHLLNYQPDTDIRAVMVKDVLKILESANELTRKMKTYIESSLYNLPPEVKYWNPETIATYHRRLNEALIEINMLLQNISDSDPHTKLIREEVRTTKSGLLDRVLFVRIKPEDREIIRRNADKCMLSISTYIRFIATGRKPKSRECLTACRELAKVQGDLGRIKGIMHYWLSKDSHLYGLPKATRLMIIMNAKQAILNQKLTSLIFDQFSYMLS